MTRQALFVWPQQAREVERAPGPEGVHICAHSDPGQPAHHMRAAARSGGEDLVEQRLSLVLVGLLSQCELADQDLPCLGQHALLARRQATLPVPAPQIADDLGYLVHVARGELLKVGLVPSRPVGRFLGVRGAKHLEHLFQPFLPDNVPYAYQLRIVSGNAYGQVTLVDLENEVRLVLTLDRTGLDLFDASSPMVGVDDRVADLKSHVAHTPSAKAMLARPQGFLTCRSR